MEVYEKVSLDYRKRTLDKSNKKVLITNFLNSLQAKDFTVPPNCNGYGRIRHFKKETSAYFPSNPLPIDPAAKALGIPSIPETMQAQVFQTASCNWRCWYCYVPYSLLSANPKYSAWLSPRELVDYYLSEEIKPSIIDISGGQPELVPEFILWTMEALVELNLENQVFLWSDDNLSNDFFWRFLSETEIDKIVRYSNYSRVGCFKGFDKQSFSYNTNAKPENFDQQFDLMKRYIETGLDMYGYATFTFIDEDNRLDYHVKTFIDRLQEISENLPLRVIPLEILPFSAVKTRMNTSHQKGIENQYKAIEIWKKELTNRFANEMLNLRISSVPLSN